MAFGIKKNPATLRRRMSRKRLKKPVVDVSVFKRGGSLVNYALRYGDLLLLEIRSISTFHPDGVQKEILPSIRIPVSG